jgi:hypothetical protein
MDERERRIGLNEALFREVNEAVSGISEKFHSQTFEIVCECGDTACTDRIELRREEYEAVRSESTQFVIKPGHEIPDVETTVGRHDNYVVVMKVAPEAAEMAERTDPRHQG